MSPAESSRSRSKLKRERGQCAEWKLETRALFKLDTPSTATYQSVAKDLQYAQSKEKDERTRTIARRN